ncbi:MAG TPA: glutamate--cysteine ligase [Gammaproteobacteria bacterium]|nr:glutamate--cysteine ligase [Gammaproteobacteria bacterium]
MIISSTRSGHSHRNHRVSEKLARIIEKIEQAEVGVLSASMRRGLEKESLRIDAEGVLSQQPHPAALGAALTHRYITTDYSEALLEFITPVTDSVEGLLEFLTELHQFTYHNIGDEKLWVNSMPCILYGEESIPIAYYGESNAGRMKTVYRQGLAYRYGKLMQTISGIHFNFSLDDNFWRVYRDISRSTVPLRDFKSEAYLGLIRNFYRCDWVIPYLFGASPAVCGTFLEGRSHHLKPLGEQSFYLPHATSLRLSDLGYQSDAQASVNLSLNSLDEYTESLVKATTKPYPPYRKIGIRVNGEYRQLNDSLLQIENEYYATMRPKRVANSGERPSHALQARGVDYIEVRSLDLDPFLPIGIDADGIRFLDLMMISCLLDPSPPMDWDEFRRVRTARSQIAESGREPGFVITKADGQRCSVQRCGLEFIDYLEPLADCLSRYDDRYRTALALKRRLFEDPQMTPSARALDRIHGHDDTFFYFAKAQAEHHEGVFKHGAIDKHFESWFQQEAASSLQRAEQMEQDDEMDFETFLDQYFGR